ncbi:hypothetical protein OXX69_001301 [Metschnikowia pulcherrima]
MADSTQELVARFSNGEWLENSSSTYTKTPFGGDRLFPNEDPLEDKTDMKKFPILTLPPTPQHSPLKMDMDRLRGSPIKTPRRQFKAPRAVPKTPFRDENEQPYSPLSIHELDESFDPLSAFDGNVVRDTKQLGGYQSLLSATADRLTHELHIERARTTDLKREVEALKEDKFDADRLKTDLDTLQKQNSNLRSRNLSLELQVNNLQRNDKSEQLARENKLLKEKLLKYKKLYESVKAQANIAVPESRDQPHSKEPEPSTNPSKPPNLQPQNKDFVQPQNQQHDVPVHSKVPVSDTSSPAVWQDARFIDQLKRIVQALDIQSQEELGKKRSSRPSVEARTAHGNDFAPANSPKRSFSANPPLASKEHVKTHLQPEPTNEHEKPCKQQPRRPVSADEHRKPTEISAKPTPVESTNPEELKNVLYALPDCKDQFARLEQILNHIRDDLKRQQTSVTEKPDTPIPRNCVCARPNTASAAKTCPACSGISSGLLTRPHSESTPKENDTQALMGRYSWNRTL